MEFKTISIEDMLTGMSKPEIKNLHHEDMLEEAITNSKDKSAISFWWIIIPLFVIAAYWMKSYFMPGSSFPSNLGELTEKNSYAANLIFILIPAVLIIVNLLSIKRIYFFSGSSPTAKFLTSVSVNIFIIIISIILMLVYLI